MKYILCLSLFLSACASYEVTTTGRALRTEGEYFETVENNTTLTRRYSGLYNILEIEATLLKSQVLDAQLDQQTRIYLWDEVKFQEEKAKVNGRLNKETELFVGFFTPERKNDDAASPTTTWRVFLDADGRRYEGKVTKLKVQFAELISLYPYFNRFHTPYKVVFAVPMKSIENKDLKVTVTGPVGSAALDYKVH